MHYDDGAFWRPLFEGDMIPLQVAKGCSHNRCRFCDMYKQPFEASDLEDIAGDIKEIAAYVPMAQRIFLTGGNALCLPQENLVFTLEQLRESMPSKPSVGCFARITDVARKSDSQLAQLAELGLENVSIGSESGYDPALVMQDKGFTAADIERECLRLEKAGLAYSLFFLLGMGGKGKGAVSADKTAALDSKLRPEYIMIHTMTAFPGTKLWGDIQSGRFQPADELENVAELRRFVEKLDTETFILGNHIGNAVRVNGYVPDQREDLLAALDWGLEHLDEEQLRTWRAGMRSI